MTNPVNLTLEIVNEKGLHARASAQLVELIEGYDSSVKVSREGETASGDSIMGLLMLAAAKGTTIDVCVEGADAEALAEAITELVVNRFGEDC